MSVMVMFAVALLAWLCDCRLSTCWCVQVTCFRLQCQQCYISLFWLMSDALLPGRLVQDVNCGMSCAAACIYPHLGITVFKH